MCSPKADHVQREEAPSFKRRAPDLERYSIRASSFDQREREKALRQALTLRALLMVLETELLALKDKFGKKGSSNART